MKFRRQHGGFAESMATTREMPSTVEALAGLLKVPPGAIKVTPYGGIDPRNGWDTYLVSVNGCGVGFTDSAVTDR